MEERDTESAEERGGGEGREDSVGTGGWVLVVLG